MYISTSPPKKIGVSNIDHDFLKWGGAGGTTKSSICLDGFSIIKQPWFIPITRLLSHVDRLIQLEISRLMGVSMLKPHGIRPYILLYELFWFAFLKLEISHRYKYI